MLIINSENNREFRKLEIDYLNSIFELMNKRKPRKGMPREKGTLDFLTPYLPFFKAMVKNYSVLK